MAKVKHIVLAKVKEGTSQDQIDQVYQDILDISESISGIEDYVSGPNCSPEGMNHGYNHGFVMTFSDLEARNGYLGNPEREKINAALQPLVESTIVFDFEIS